ncbi:MAG TPA: hypothetical protein VLC93_06310, partial [Myxococcota bacterium]|nr:hypothetical protein [Myxococcota bacterium]
MDDVIASLPCLGVSEGAACDDADACTRASICTGGACVATELETCDDDGVACTSESCDPAFGCHRPDDTFCDNGTFCDGAERCDALAGCQAATTFTCDDGVSCSVDSCDEGNDTCVNDPAACFVYGYFVMTSAAYDGNLGGLAGANARCLSDLQGSNWLGKASASLTSANVRAWLCDDTTCQNHTPGVLYKFARAGSATAGGNTLLVDHLGRGPFQHATANPWQGGAYFGVAANYWAGRDQFSQLVDGFAWEDQVFPTEPKGVSCAGWTSNAAGQNGEFATTNPAGCCAERQWDSGGGACSSANLRLLCIVEPTAPQDRAPENFAFASSSNVGPGEVLTQTVVVRGIDTSIPAVVATVDVFDTTQWTAELRNATTASPWSNAAVIRPGDTLEVRTTSSPYLGTTMPVEVSLGSQLFAWNIGTRAPSPEVNNGYMVLSRDLYDGNLGGLAGANARCLDELQRLPWLGVGRVVLDASSVRAMLCDGSTCQGPAPGTKYFFANSGSFTVGGGFFISDGSGAGPGNDSDWAPPFSSYFSYPFFPSVVGWWTGRQAGTATLWPVSSHADTCAGWTSTSGVAGNFGDLGAGGSQRWSSASGACGVPRHLMCLVTPGRAPFGFADVEGAAANTLYVRSAVVTGITGTSTASILGTAELRNVTDAGPWGASVSVRSG